MKEVPLLFNGPMVRALLDGRKTQTRRIAKPNRLPLQRGDRIWVRETWQYWDWTEDGQPFIRYAADFMVKHFLGPDEEGTLDETWAALSVPANYDIEGAARDRRWRPSVHMPRWACRILLDVTEVRCQRVQDITQEDAIAEGVERTECGYRDYQLPETVLHGVPARYSFRSLWNSIHGPGAWERNDYVWAYTFKRAQEEK